MNLEENFQFDSFAEKHEDFLQSLQDFPVSSLRGVDLREYQQEGIAKFRSDVLSGQTKGQFILGTGGGKTTISKAIIAGTRGRTLYVGPSRTSAQQGKAEFDRRGIDKTCQVLNESTPFRKFDPSAEVTYGTAQMFIYDDRYRNIDPDHFDLVIFDEAHHFLGKKFAGLSGHFNAAQIFMTATPGNMRTHISSLAPHKFFEFASNELIEKEGFPVWRVYRHEVSDEHFERATMVGDKIQMEGNELKILNLPHRFAITRDLFLESVAKGERRIAFMPSVASSKEFISAIVDSIPALRGKVLHVDGSTKNVGEILKAFRRGEILGVCCKDLWNESLDIPEIAAVTLVDPSCSERVIMQRIGRGARPAHGKTSLRIDDVVSCVPNMSYASAKAEGLESSVRRPLTVHGILGLKKYIPGAPVNGPEAKIIYRDVTQYESAEIPFNERHLSEDMAFIRNPGLGAALMMEFARVFGTSPVNIFTQPKIFFNRSEKITIETHDGETFELDFEDSYKAATLFGSIRRIEDEVLRGVEASRKSTAKKVKAVIERKENVPEKSNLPLSKEAQDKMRFFDRLLMGAVYKKSSQEYKIVEILKGEGGKQAVPFSEPICFTISTGDDSFEKAINRVVQECARQDIHITSHRKIEGKSVICNLSVKFDSESVEANARAYEKCLAFLNIKFEDPSLKSIWRSIFDRCCFEDNSPLSTGFYEDIDNNLADRTRYGEKANRIIISKDRIVDICKQSKTWMDPFVLFRKLQFELKKIGIEMEFEEQGFSGNFLVKELNAKDLNVESASGTLGEESMKQVSVRDIYFDMLSPEYLARETERNINYEKKEKIPYTLILNLAKIVLAKLKQSDEFEIPASEFSDPRCEKIFDRLNEDLAGNLGMFDTKYEFEKSVENYKFKFTAPDDERMQKWNRGRLKYEGLRDISFGTDHFANHLWNELMHQFASADRLKYLFFDDFDSIKEDASNKVVPITAENTETLKKMQTQLAEMGIKFEFTAALPTERDVGNYWFALNVDEMKISESDLRPSQIVKSPEEIEKMAIKIGQIKWQVLDVIDENVFANRIRQYYKEKGEYENLDVHESLFKRVCEILLDKSTQRLYSADFRKNFAKGQVVKDEFFITNEDLKIENPEKYLELINLELDMFGPSDLHLKYKKTDGGFECEWIFPDDETMLDWDENRRIWEMVSNIRFEVSNKETRQDILLKSFWAEISRAFIDRECYRNHGLFGDFKHLISTMDEAEKMIPKIEANDENKAVLERLKLELAKFKIAFSFEVSQDGKILIPKLDMSETVPMDGRSKLPKGVEFQPVPDYFSSAGLWLVRAK